MCTVAHVAKLTAFHRLAQLRYTRVDRSCAAAPSSIITNERLPLHLPHRPTFARRKLSPIDSFPQALILSSGIHKKAAFSSGARPRPEIDFSLMRKAERVALCR